MLFSVGSRSLVNRIMSLIFLPFLFAYGRSAAWSIVLRLHQIFIGTENAFIVIDEGGVKEQGNHHQLMELDGIYARYFNMQFEGLDVEMDA